MIFRTILSLVFLTSLSLNSYASNNDDPSSGYFAEVLGASEGNDLIIWKKADNSIIDAYAEVPWLGAASVSDTFEAKDSVVLLVKNYGDTTNYKMYPLPSQAQIDALGGVAVRFPVEVYDADGDGVLDYVMKDFFLAKNYLFSGAGVRSTTSIIDALSSDQGDYFDVTAVKPIEGGAGVDAFGNATYGFSLELPVSPTGLTPSLSVSYNSAAGYGNFGVGWSLGGLSSISRCVAVYDRSPLLSQINHSASDSFCLDGRYIDKALGHTEIDDFRRVSLVSGVWTVYDTSGYTTTYKSHLGGLIFLPDERFETGHSENKISYNYIVEGNEVSLNKIDYAYAGASNKFTVEINYYENTKGRFNQIVSGKASESGRLIKNVLIKGSGKRINQYHFFYDAPNNDSAFVAKLKGVQHCGFQYSGFSQSCGQPLKLDWHDENKALNFSSLFSVQVNDSSPLSENERYSYLDLNGDGKKVTVEDDISMLPLYNYKGHKDALIRLERDSRREVKNCVSNVCSSSTMTQLDSDGNVIWSNSSGSGQYSTQSFVRYSWFVVLDGVSKKIENACVWLPESERIKQYVFGRKSTIRGASLDLNADGDNDLILPVTDCQQSDSQLANNLVGRWKTYIGKDYGSGPVFGKNETYYSPQAFSLKVVPEANGTRRQVITLDSGVVVPMRLSSSVKITPVFKDTMNNVWKENSNSLYYGANTSLLIPAERAVAGDFNNDGLTDIIAPEYDWSISNTRIEHWKLYKNRGRIGSRADFMAPYDLGLSLSVSVSAEEYAAKKIKVTSQVSKAQSKVQLVDLTGDGLPDVVVTNQHTGAMQICPQIKNKITTCISWAANEMKFRSVPEDISFVDITGDGALDLVAFDKIGHFYRPGIGINRNILKTAEGNIEQTFTYKTLSKGADYSSSTGWYNGSKRVVTSRAYTSTNGGRSTINYAYKNAKVNYKGRGFLGFSEISSEDSLTGLKTVSTYTPSFGLVGLPNNRLVTKNLKPLSKIINTWDKNCDCVWLGRVETSQFETTANNKHEVVSKTLKVLTRGANNELEKSEVTVLDGSNTKLKSVVVDHEYDYINPMKALIKQPSSSTTIITAHVDNSSVGFNVNSAWNEASSIEFTHSSKPELSSGIAKSSRITEAVQYVNTPNYYLKTSYQYSDEGLLLNTKVEGNSNAENPISPRSFGIAQAYGFTDGLYPNATKDTLGHVTKYTYHPSLGAVATITDPNGIVTRNMYREFGTLYKSSTDNQPSILKISDRCDKNNHNFGCSITGVSDPGVKKYLYHWVKNYLSDGSNTTHYYDVKGRLRLSQEYRQHKVYVHHKYDDLGRKIAVSMPFRAGDTPVYTTYGSFDAFNRPGMVIKANGHKIESSFQLDASTNTRVNKTKQTVYKADGSFERTLTHVQWLNALGQTEWVMGPLESAVAERLDAHYTYDLQGNMNRTMLYPGGGPTTTGGTAPAVPADKHIQIDTVYDIAGNRTYMKDPSLGESHSKYDALNQLRYTRKGSLDDAQPHDWTNRHYDVLGRMVQREEQGWQIPLKSSSWYFDHSTECDLAGQVGHLNVVGGLCKKTDDIFVERYGFNANGQTTYQQTDAGYKTPFVFQYSYNSIGQLTSETYPSNKTVKYSYAFGRLLNVSDEDVALVKYMSRDVFGNATFIRYNNGLTLKHQYNKSTGLPKFHAQRNGAIGNSLSWNSTGWLTQSRESRGEGVSAPEGSVFAQTDYSYDNNGRIKTFNTTDGGYNQAYEYDVLGNLSKIQKGIIGYINMYDQTNGASPFAVTGLKSNYNGGSYKTDNNIDKYDFKGNRTKGGGANYKYTSFNKPYSFTYYDSRYIDYGPDHKRYKTAHVSGKSVYTTYYINSGRYELKTSGQYKGHRTINGQSVLVDSGITRIVRETSNVTGDIAFQNIPSDSKNAYEYHIKDHLGSINIIYNENKKITDGLGYYPFGKSYRKTFSTNGSETPVAGLLNITPNMISDKRTRGFTGHEDMGEFTHMNGRTYDHSYGRFNSADPLIQNPYNPQNFNRYSYVLNSPMIATDPSGYAGLTQSTSGLSNLVLAGIGFGVTQQNNQSFEVAYPLSTTIPGSEITDIDSNISLPGLLIPDAMPISTELPILGNIVSSLFVRLMYDASSISNIYTALIYEANSKGSIYHSEGGFKNQLPGQLLSELEVANDLGVIPVAVGTPEFDELANQGRIKWAVTSEGKLLAVPYSVGGQEISHAVISGGGNVQAAGQADIVSFGGVYIGTSFNTHSGHFLNGVSSSSNSIADQIGRQAFNDACGCTFE